MSTSEHLDDGLGDQPPLERESITRRSFFARTMGLVAGSLALSSFEAGSAKAMQQGQLSFEQLKAEAYQAWNEHRWADAESLFVQASNYGELGQSELQTVSLIRRRFLDRPEDSLPVAQYNYQRYPCAFSASELCDSYGDNYDFNSGRGVIADFCGVARSDLGNRELVLRTLENTIRGCQREDEKTLLRHSMFRVGVKEYEVTYTLTPDVIVPFAREEIEKRGYQKFYFYPDCADQQISCEVVDDARHTITTDQAGNRILSIWRKDNGVSPKVTMRITLTGSGYDIRKTESRRDEIPAEVQPYLGKTTRIDPTGEIAVALAGQLKGKTRYETIRNLDDWFAKNVTGGALLTQGTMGESEVMLRERRGYCWEQSRGLAAVLRACGIPARQLYVMLLLPYRNIDNLGDAQFGGHLVVEFYDPVYGWIPWEPGKRIGESSFGFIRFMTESPDETSPLGTLEKQFYETFYGPPKDVEHDNPMNVQSRLVGFSLENPHALTGAK